MQVGSPREAQSGLTASVAGRNTAERHEHDMKIISLIEPWASLMAVGAKQNETRSWSTKYRGDLAIAASNRKVWPIIQQCDHDMIVSCMSALHEGYGRPSDCGGLWDYLDANTIGRILCVVNLNSCCPTSHLDAGWFRAGSAERLFGNYQPNRFVWRTDNLRRLRDPIPWKGTQGLRDVPPDVEAEIRRRL